MDDIRALIDRIVVALLATLIASTSFTIYRRAVQAEPARPAAPA